MIGPTKGMVLYQPRKERRSDEEVANNWKEQQMREKEIEDFRWRWTRIRYEMVRTDLRKRKLEALGMWVTPNLDKYLQTQSGDLKITLTYSATLSLKRGVAFAWTADGRAKYDGLVPAAPEDEAGVH